MFYGNLLCPAVETVIWKREAEQQADTFLDRELKNETSIFSPIFNYQNLAVYVAKILYRSTRSQN
jgi:hypothetical protein